MTDSQHFSGSEKCRLRTKLAAGAPKQRDSEHPASSAQLEPRPASPGPQRRWDAEHLPPTCTESVWCPVSSRAFRSGVSTRRGCSVRLQNKPQPHRSWDQRRSTRTLLS